LALDTQLLRLALMAYEAAAEPELWPGFMKQFTEAVSADTTVLQIHDLERHTSVILNGFGINSPFTQSYNEHYSKLNVWREGGRAYYAAGRVNLSEEQYPRPLLERSEFYNDYLLRIGGAYSMGTVLAREENRAPTLTALRGRREFGEPEREIARFLAPYLSRAWIVLQRLGLLAAGESVLDTLPLGVVFLMTGGRAIYWNHAADQVFRGNDGLSLRNGVLSAVDRKADSQLRKAVDHALSPCRPLGAAAVPIPRASLRRAYQIVAAPLRRRFPQFAGMPAPAAVALITDPEKQEPANIDLLIQIYKLTPKEAMIAAKLSEGKSVEQTAKELAVSYETARTHLRRIFSKTETSRQTELLLLMARLPARVPSHNG
jgi:DNA-binding CsgD family transcriptional regulator